MDLSVQKREKFGKAVNALRKQGLIPAELYGHGVKNLHLAVPARDFLKTWKEAGTNTVVYVSVESRKYPALIYEVKKNYLTGDVEHVDLYAVRMDEKIKAKIPLEFVGEAPAVKEKGGILNRAMAEIEVEALPANLPHSFKVDISWLDDFNKSVYVKDIEVPKDVSVAVGPEMVVVTVTPPAKEEEKVEVPVDVGEVKVEGEEKKAERAAEKAKIEEGATSSAPKEEAPKKAQSNG